jgi:hypothetical protein
MASVRKRLPILLLAFVAAAPTPPPPYLAGTGLPPAFIVNFTIHEKGEIKPPNPANQNQMWYLTQGSSIYFKSVFPQAALIPGEPTQCKDKALTWFIQRDPAYDNFYTAKAFCTALKTWTLVGVNFGPPRADMVARFSKYIDMPPLWAPRAGSKLPLLPPPSQLTEWYLTSPGHPSAAKQGYFAMLHDPITVNGVAYKPMYSLVGAGAGVFHQATGELIYGPYDLTTPIPMGAFTEPTGYTQIPTSAVPGGEKMIATDCGICHIVEKGRKPQLLGPAPPSK